MTFFNIIYVCVAVVLLFGAAIFCHELGHFWVARKLGMKVEEFAIGMGPKIFSRVHNGVLYSVRCIPAGGFVKLPQMVTSDTLEGKTDPAIPPAPPLHKILVALAGPFMNVVLAFVVATIIYFTGLPLLVNPSVIGYVPPGSEEENLGIKPGDRIVAVNGNPVSSWQQILMETAFAQTNVVPVSIAHEGVTNIYHLTATPGNMTGGVKLLNLGSREHPVVGPIDRGSPAEKAGLVSEDKIIAFADVQLVSSDQLRDLVDKNGTQPAELTIERGGKIIKLTVTPVYDSGHKRHRIGIGFGVGGTYYQVQKPGPLPWVKVADVWRQTIRTLNALFHSKKTGVGLGDLSGPPGILAMLGSQIATDYRLALSFLVLLNINLAILNLLPIPVLDGGHIVMSIIEKVRGRPLGARFVEYTTTAFAILLISLILYVSFNDFKRFPLFKAMFQNETRIEESGAPAPPSAPAAQPAK